MECPSWLREGLSIWFQYLRIALVAIPCAIVGVFLLDKGYREPSVLVICVGLTLIVAFTIQRFVLHGKERSPREQLVVLIILMLPDLLIALVYFMLTKRVPHLRSSLLSSLRLIRRH